MQATGSLWKIFVVYLSFIWLAQTYSISFQNKPVPDRPAYQYQSSMQLSFISEFRLIIE